MPRQRKNKKPLGYHVVFEDGTYIYLRGVTTEREARDYVKDHPPRRETSVYTPEYRFKPYYREDGR